MRKRKSIILPVIILFSVCIAIFSFGYYGYQQSILSSTKYWYHCEGGLIYELNLDTDEDDYYADCNDYYVNKRCRGRNIESTVKISPEDTARLLCSDATSRLNNSVVYMNGKITECYNDYDFCYNIRTTNEDFNTNAQYSWSWITDGKVTLNYQCKSSDGVSQGGLVYRLSTYDTRITCKKKPGSEDYICGGFHTNPANQGNEYRYGDTGIIEISYIDLIDWDKTNSEFIYIHAGCFGKYYADYKGDYVLIQDYLKIPIALIDQCVTNNDCNVGLEKTIEIPPVVQETTWFQVKCNKDGVVAWRSSDRTQNDDGLDWNDWCSGNIEVLNEEVRTRVIEEGYTKTEYVKIFDDSINRECKDGRCVEPMVCGDGVCEVGENCPQDCDIPIVCGDGICDMGEQCIEDCGCNNDTFICPNGVEVKRNPNNNCNFYECIDCVDMDWMPNAKDFCKTEEITQTSNCGNTRVVNGEKNCETRYLVVGIASTLLAIFAGILTKIL